MAKQQKTKSKEPESTVSHVITGDELGLSAGQEQEVNTAMFGDYIRAFVQNRRQGTVAVKTRGEVAFSNKKPWKQKGTGRARVGSRRSPLWRKGGVIFGPQPRVRKLKIPRAMKKVPLMSLLQQRLEHSAVIALDWSVGEQPKTAHAFRMLQSAGFNPNKKVILFVSREDQNVHASFSNIAHVDMLSFDQPNAYAMARGEYWVFLSKDKESFKKMVASWI